MGWLNNTLEALKSFPEVTIPAAVGTVAFIIGLSFLKTWRAVKVARINTGKLVEANEKLRTELIAEFANVMKSENSLKATIDQQSLMLQAFIDAVMNSGYNEEQKAYYERKVKELQTEIIRPEYIDVKEPVITEVQATKKKLKKRAGA